MEPQQIKVELLCTVTRKHNLKTASKAHPSHAQIGKLRPAQAERPLEVGYSYGQNWSSDLSW